MKNQVRIKHIAELFPITEITAGIRGKVNCIDFNSEDIVFRFSSPLFLRATVAIFVLSGTGVIWVNARPYEVCKGTLVLLSASHLFYFSKCTSDFSCKGLFVSKDFMDEMDSTDMIYRRIKYGVRLYNAPVVRLDSIQVALLQERITAIGDMLDDTDHLYQKEMVLNCLFAFYLDLSNMLDRREEFRSDGSLTRYECIIKSFIELLVSYYRKEHKVDFYASRLNISAHYLTLIVKRITGQSACDFIFEMLYSESRNLLVYSRLSIQEIASLLNFSDQSSFGKFFRRKSGLSPADYRKLQR